MTFEIQVTPVSWNLRGPSFLLRFNSTSRCQFHDVTYTKNAKFNVAV